MSSHNTEISIQLNDAKISHLIDHYKETIAYIREFEDRRDRFLLYILILVALLLIQLAYSSSSKNLITSIIIAVLDVNENTAIDASILSPVIWFSLLALVVRYFQIVGHIQHRYRYVHELENIISPEFQDIGFTRHGKFYWTSKPVFSSWAQFLYQKIFPFVLLMAVTVKVRDEWLNMPQSLLILLFNSIIYIFLVISVLLYLRMISIIRPQ